MSRAPAAARPREARLWRRHTGAVLLGATGLVALTGCQGTAAKVSCATTALPTHSAGALDQQIAATSGGNPLSLTSGTFTFTNFDPASGTQRVGLFVPTGLGGIRGSGSATTVLEMAPHSSTAADTIPTTFPHTNQLSLLRLSGADPDVSGFTLVGTDQGHPYNGLRVQGTTGARITDVCVSGIPGTDHHPPGETFGINDFRTDGSTYSNVRVDGQQIGAAGFGGNASRNISISQSAFVDNEFSAGATFWQVSGIRLTDVTSVDNGWIGLNFERVKGRVSIIRPVLSGNGGGDLRIASDDGSATYTIEDPSYSGATLNVVLPDTYDGKPNLQRRSDVRVLRHGRDVTAAVLRFVRP